MGIQYIALILLVGNVILESEGIPNVTAVKRSIRDGFPASIIVENVLEVINGELIITPSLFEETIYDRIEVELSCQSQLPIEWIFGGPNYPTDFSSANLESGRYDKIDCETTGAEIFYSKLRFVRTSSESTGSYICHTRGNPEDQVAIYVIHQNDWIFFEPNFNYFLDTTFPSPFTKVYFLSEDQLTTNSTLPILSNVPDGVSIDFYRSNGEPIPFGEDFSYDKRSGLWIDFTSPTFANLFGIFFTRVNSGEEEAFSSLNFAILPQPTITPNVDIIQFTDTALVNFTCENSEPITLVLSNDPLDGSEVSAPTYLADNKTATWMLTPADFLYGTRLTCELRDEPYPRLSEYQVHSWMFADPIAPSIRRDYNPATRMHKCCTNYHFNPLLLKIPCSDFTTCSFEEVSAAYGNTVPANYTSGKTVSGEVCVEKDFSSNFDGEHSYLVSCSPGLVPDAYEFALYSQYNGVEVEISRGLPHSDSLRIFCYNREDCDDQTTFLEVPLYQTMSFFCASERFYYSEPELMVEFMDGTTRFETGGSFMGIVTDLGENYWTPVHRVTFDSARIARVTCYAGALDSEAWATRSIRVNVGPPTTAPSFTTTTTESSGTFLEYSSLLMTLSATLCYNLTFFVI